MIESAERARTLSGRLTLPLIAELRGAGLEPAPILERLALDERELRSLGARITVETFLDLRAAAIAETSDPAFPLRAARRLDKEAFPLGFYLVGSQTTLEAGYRFVKPYVSMVYDGIAVHLERSPGSAHVEFRLDDAPLGPPAIAEYLIAIVLALGRVLTPSAEAPRQVTFPHRKPRHGKASEALLGAPIHYGATGVRLVFPPAQIEAPIEGADPHLGQLLAAQAEAWATAGGCMLTLRDRARAYLVEKLEGAEPSAAHVATALKMSERTLRRKLKAEGTSHRALLDAVRKERALALLEEGKQSLDEIAYSLGFSSANAFRRAFRRWTGVPPTAYSA